MNSKEEEWKQKLYNVTTSGDTGTVMTGGIGSSTISIAGLEKIREFQISPLKDNEFFNEESEKLKKLNQLIRVVNRLVEIENRRVNK